MKKIVGFFEFSIQWIIVITSLSILPRAEFKDSITDLYYWISDTTFRCVAVYSIYHILKYCIKKMVKINYIELVSNVYYDFLDMFKKDELVYREGLTVLDISKNKELIEKKKINIRKYIYLSIYHLTNTSTLALYILSVFLSIRSLSEMFSSNNVFMYTVISVTIPIILIFLISIYAFFKFLPEKNADYIEYITLMNKFKNIIIEKYIKYEPPINQNYFDVDSFKTVIDIINETDIAKDYFFSLTNIRLYIGINEVDSDRALIIEGNGIIKDDVKLMEFILKQIKEHLNVVV